MHATSIPRWRWSVKIVVSNLYSVPVLYIVGGLTGGPSERFLRVEVLNGKFRLENIMRKLLKLSYEVDKIYSVKEELCLIVM